MARRYRSVFPGHPHHVIQRGNRRQNVFFKSDDYLFYLKLLRHYCDLYGVKIWGYCLMGNHVHLVLVPLSWEALSRAVADTHKIYTREINKRYGWRGYLWQGRFLSFILHEMYYWSVMRYIELNPVRAGIVQKAREYRWSSARAHLGMAKDVFLDEAPLLSGWERALDESISSDDLNEIRRHCSSGRPLGDAVFLEAVQKATGMSFIPAKRGPRPRLDLNSR